MTGRLLTALAASLLACASSDAQPVELLAPPGTCAHDDDPAAARDAQLAAMHCLVNHARAASGLAPVERHPLLDEAAAAKAQDVVDCGELSHTACDRVARYHAEQSGYLDGPPYRFTENLGFGTGPLGTPRHVFQGWLASPGHRANVLDPAVDHHGLGLVRVGSFTEDGETYEDAAIWVSQFGST